MSVLCVGRSQGCGVWCSVGGVVGRWVCLCVGGYAARMASAFECWSVVPIVWYMSVRAAVRSASSVGAVVRRSWRASWPKRPCVSMANGTRLGCG